MNAVGHSRVPYKCGYFTTVPLRDGIARLCTSSGNDVENVPNLDGGAGGPDEDFATKEVGFQRRHRNVVAK